MKIAQLALFLFAFQALGSDDDASKNRPVSKVITLLKDMLKQLEKEAEEDEEIYDKMACWCETNDKEKTKSIADAETRISDLTTKIEELTANSARLSTEIKNLEKEVAANQDALDKATSIREKELAEFNAEEKDLLGSISALKAAITVLSKHHGGSFLQLPRSHVLGIATTLQHEMQKHASILDGVLTRSERRAASAFIQAPEDYFDAAPTFKQSYAPQSGEIFGILRQMKETFEANLAASQKEEAASQKAYEELKAAKEEQIAAGQTQIDTKTQELADTDEKNAQAKEDIADTRASLAADEEFLMMLKEKCQMTDKEWEERQKNTPARNGGLLQSLGHFERRRRARSFHTHLQPRLGAGGSCCAVRPPPKSVETPVSCCPQIVQSSLGHPGCACSARRLHTSEESYR
jgi:hypothetical protein